LFYPPIFPEAQTPVPVYNGISTSSDPSNTNKPLPKINLPIVVPLPLTPLEPPVEVIVGLPTQIQFTPSYKN